MPFIPRLPSWNTAVSVLTWNPGTETWSAGGSLTGQLYHPHRGQPGTMFGDLYLNYPKESNIIRDPREYNIDPWVDEPPYGDAVEFTFPSAGGAAYRYWVLQVHPRWLGFPNEHLCARLRMMTAIAAALPIFTPPETFTGPSGAFAADGTCSDCEIFDDSLVDIDFVSEGLYEGTPFAWACIGGIDVHWEVTFEEPAIANLTLRETVSGDPVKAWEADMTGWSGTTPLSFDLLPTGDTARCIWPDPVELTPS